MHIALALLAGTFIGSVLGFIGAGGAMLSVPILIYGFDFNPKSATVAALLIVFSAALSGAYPKYRRGKVLIKDALVIWALALTTNIGGALLAKHLSDRAITIGFAFILIVAATSMLIGPVSNGNEKRIPLIVLIVISLIIGAMTGIFGVGGGFLAIPILVLFFHVSLEKASGTSLLIIALNCSTALITHHGEWRLINWQVPIYMAISAVFVSTFASHQSSKVPSHILRKAFSALLYVIALYTLLKSR